MSLRRRAPQQAVQSCSPEARFRQLLQHEGTVVNVLRTGVPVVGKAHPLGPSPLSKEQHSRKRASTGNPWLQAVMEDRQAVIEERRASTPQRLSRAELTSIVQELMSKLEDGINENSLLAKEATEQREKLEAAFRAEQDKNKADLRRVQDLLQERLNSIQALEKTNKTIFDEVGKAKQTLDSIKLTEDKIVEENQRIEKLRDRLESEMKSLDKLSEWSAEAEKQLKNSDKSSAEAQQAAEAAQAAAAKAEAAMQSTKEAFASEKQAIEDVSKEAVLAAKRAEQNFDTLKTDFLNIEAETNKKLEEQQSKLDLKFAGQVNELREELEKQYQAKLDAKVAEINNKYEQLASAAKAQDKSRVDARISDLIDAFDQLKEDNAAVLKQVKEQIDSSVQSNASSAEAQQTLAVFSQANAEKDKLIANLQSQLQDELLKEREANERLERDVQKLQETLESLERVTQQERQLRVDEEKKRLDSQEEALREKIAENVKETERKFEKANEVLRRKFEEQLAKAMTKQNDLPLNEVQLDQVRSLARQIFAGIQDNLLKERVARAMKANKAARAMKAAERRFPLTPPSGEKVAKRVEDIEKGSSSFAPAPVPALKPAQPSSPSAAEIPERVKELTDSLVSILTKKIDKIESAGRGQQEMEV